MDCCLTVCLPIICASYPNPHIAVRFKDHGKLFSQKTVKCRNAGPGIDTVTGSLSVLNQMKIVRTTWAKRRSLNA